MLFCSISIEVYSTINATFCIKKSPCPFPKNTLDIGVDLLKLEHSESGAAVYVSQQGRTDHLETRALPEGPGS
ncbi:unnamed protein product, partial [Staurois parvus]